MSEKNAADRKYELSKAGQTTSDTDTPIATADEVLELLGDEYVREILRRLLEEPKTARELIDTMSASKPTVYRRLNQLEQNGIVDSDHIIHPKGHHARRHFLVVKALNIAVCDGELTLELVPGKAGASNSSEMVASGELSLTRTGDA